MDNDPAIILAAVGFDVIKTKCGRHVAKFEEYGRALDGSKRSLESKVC